jgi:hypothetical protein
MSKPLLAPPPFLDIFRDLVIALQPRHLEKDASRVYFLALGDFTIETLREAALRLSRTKTFFPTTGEWFQVATDLRREAQRALAEEPTPCDDKGIPKVGCDRCGDTGSVFVDCPGDASCGRRYPHASHAFVCVCACRPTNRLYQRRQAAVVRIETEPDSD